MSQRTVRLALVMLLVVIIVPIIYPFVGMAWEPVNCSYQDIDLQTGRVRYTKMLYCIPVSQKNEHTYLSKTLKEDDTNSDYGTWKRVNTFSPGVKHSPHHTFHGALSQIHKLKVIWEMEGFDNEAREESAREILRLWAITNSASGADGYIDGLSH